MLSYRHAFHAGNFADVLKHLVLVHSLRYLTRKDKPLLYLDTHAGAGAYELSPLSTGKRAEFQDGIGRLWECSDLPAAVADYVALVRRFNGGEQLHRYPGSPWFAAQLLRSQDRMVLHELHPADFALLQAGFRGERRVQVRREDGFRACRALLPPPERRAFVLLDPPYELKEDYQRVVDTVRDAHRRFAGGTYAIWYPVVERRRITRLEQAIASAGLSKVLLLELGVAADRPGLGMTASGMLIVNPPWSLGMELEPALAYLAERLGRAGHGHFRVVQPLAG